MKKKHSPFMTPKGMLSFLLCMALLFATIGCQAPAATDPTATEPAAEPTATAPVTATQAPASTPAYPVPSYEDVPVEPAIWAVSRSGSEPLLYLFGSIHAAESNLYPFPATVMDAFNAADALAVEVDMLAFQSDMEAQVSYNTKMMYTDGGTIADEIDAETLEKARALIDESGMLPYSSELLNPFRPALWHSLLTNIAIAYAGLSADSGVDMHFLTLAQEAGKEILEVESLESQLALLTGYSPALNQWMLEDLLDMDAQVEGLEKLYRAWKQGKMDDYLEAELEGETVDEDIDEALQADIDAYTTAMLTDRNRHMADAAKQYINDGILVFFVVGAMHMLGDDGIVELLVQDGYNVERLYYDGAEEASAA